MALVGVIARPHGLRGQVIVNVETDFPQDRFRPGAALFVKRGQAVESLSIDTVRFHRDRPVISFRGVDDVDAAKALAGAELRVPLEELAPLPDGSYYLHDLVGCQVETTDGRTIGQVTKVQGAAGGSRLEVRTSGGDVLVPLAQEICRTIDTAARRIVIDPPEGLLELNRSGARD